MHQAWDWSGDIQRHVETLKGSQAKMLGKGFGVGGGGGGYAVANASGEPLQSGNAPNDVSKKGAFLDNQLPAGVGQTGQLGEPGQAGQQQNQQNQQNQQLFLSPAGLQLAQLQAQLTLHRLRLAQGAAGGNAASGAGGTSAASVLNQVLSSVAMSQPLLSQLRSSNPQSAFPTGALGFPNPSSALGALVGGTFSHSLGNVALNSYGGGPAAGQQGGGDYGKKPGYPSDTDRRAQYSGFRGAGAAAATSKAGDGQYAAGDAQANITDNGGFQREYYGQETRGQQSAFCGGDQKMRAYPCAGSKESWKGNTGSLCHTGKMDASANAKGWNPCGQPARQDRRADLYNPEEPTPDPKFSAGGGPAAFPCGSQGFLAFQAPQAGEEAASGGSRTLQQHQVNDYHGVTPPHLPHQCTICDKKVYNLKDWDQHVNGKLHLQNRSVFCAEGGAGLASGAEHFAGSGASNGGLSAVGSNSMVYSAPTQDVPSGTNLPYLPAAGMKTYPMSAIGFTVHQPGAKPFAPRKSTPGRVVHICNLPEGSCTESDVINLGLPFGKVTNYILMRSTHQAFLEMAFVEAAQAMVQYYQLTPAMINDQKLLIRMSKRYKELQLKKPGKDVDSIIYDINSQRVRDEMQEPDHYAPERARSRSPISRSLSPRSHSPSFTSCSSAHSPPGGPCRGPERAGAGPGGPRRGSWDRTGRQRGRADEERDELLWRNGSGGADDDRRGKHYAKPPDRSSPRTQMGEPRGGGGGGGGGGEGMRGSRDWYPRSPQGVSFSCYRSPEEDFYSKDQGYKTEKTPRAPYQRHEPKPKRRDAGGDYHARSRHSESEMTEELCCRTPEDRKQGSPRGNRKKTSRRHGTKEKQESQLAPGNTTGNAAGNADHQMKDTLSSPQQSRAEANQTEITACVEERHCEAEACASGEDPEGDGWYPGNMEELVTVDEVGGEDDSIVEPDLRELLEGGSCSGAEPEPVRGPPPAAVARPSPPAAVARPSPPAAVAAEEAKAPEPGVTAPERPPPELVEAEPPRLVEAEPPRVVEVEPPQVAPQAGRVEAEAEAEAEAMAVAGQPADSEAPAPPVSDLNNFPGRELRAALEEACADGEAAAGSAAPAPEERTASASEDAGAVQDAGPAPETRVRDARPREETPKTGVPAVSSNPRPTQTEIHGRSPTREQDRVVAEHSIPLGVEFIVPRSGFFCKLCGLFYASEETAKTSHCRSTVHYRNLQKYLSQLAEESLLGALTRQPSAE